MKKNIFKDLFSLSGIVFLAIPLLVSAQSYAVDFTEYIYAKNNPEGKISSLTENIYLPVSGTFEVIVHFRANHGPAEAHEEFFVYIDSDKIGKTTDPNQGDDYEVQSLGTRQLSQGNHSIKVEHAYDYSSYGLQDVYPLEVILKLVQEDPVSSPDLTISKSVDKTTAGKGDILTYTLNYSNTGNAKAFNVVLRDDFSESYTDIYEANGGNLSYGRVIWNLGDLAAGTSGSKILKVRIKDSLTSSVTIYNSAEIEVCGVDIEQSNTVQTYVDIPIININHPPVANAGSDKDIYENQSVVLNGSGYDPDGDSVSYAWSCSGGSLSNYSIAQPTFYGPSVSSDTNYTCTLTVTDEHGLSDSDSANILVRNNYQPPVNHPPVANAGPDRDIYENQSITLLGSGSDPDGDSVSYAWSCSGGSLSNYSIAQPTFYGPSVSSDTNYTCTLTVTDEHGLSDSDSANILVREQNINEYPQVETNSPGNVQENQATLYGTLDEIGGSYTYVYFQWGTSNSYGYNTSEYAKYNTGSFSQVIYGLNKNTLYHYRAVARNNEGEIDYGQDRTFYTSGYNYNNPPVANAGPDKEVYENHSVVLNGYGYDPDGGSVSYSWYCNSGSLSNRYIAQPTYYAYLVSSNTYYNCTLTVTDNEGLTDSDNMRILVRNTTDNIILDVEKTIRNLSAGQTTWYNSIYASSSDLLEFRITVRSNVSLQNVMVKDTLPSRLIYQGNLKINGVSNSNDISAYAVNVGYLSANETKTITFLAKVAAADYFSYGTTNLINSFLVYNADVSKTTSANIYVRKTEVKGVIDIPTGIFNNFFIDSLLFPLLLSILLIFLFKSQLIGFDKIWQERKAKVIEYRTERKLAKIIKRMKDKI